MSAERDYMHIKCDRKLYRAFQAYCAMKEKTVKEQAEEMILALLQNQNQLTFDEQLLAPANGTADLEAVES